MSFTPVWVYSFWVGFFSAFVVLAVAFILFIRKLAQDTKKQLSSRPVSPLAEKPANFNKPLTGWLRLMVDYKSNSLEDVVPVCTDLLLPYAG